MKLIEKHGIDEVILTQVLGWKWVSYIDIPVRGTEGYPSACRVRRLLSPKELKDPTWIQHLIKKDGRDADGTEPLDYSYCSSAGPARPPRLIILVDE